MLDSFAKAVFTLCSMLYVLHLIHTFTMVPNILHNYNPRSHLIFALARTTKDIFVRTTLQKCLVTATPMPQSNELLFLELFVAYNLIRLDDRDDTTVTFSCSGNKGALLYLPFLAERQDTFARGDFAAWILENIDACFEVAMDLGYGVGRREDIILVTGCHLAKSWVNVAFSEGRGGSQVSFEVRVSGNSGVYFDERHASGRGLKLGPLGEVSFLSLRSMPKT
jgi:hypothetical protein